MVFKFPNTLSPKNYCVTLYATLQHISLSGTYFKKKYVINGIYNNDLAI